MPLALTDFAFACLNAGGVHSERRRAVCDLGSILRQSCLLRPKLLGSLPLTLTDLAFACLDASLALARLYCEVLLALAYITLANLGSTDGASSILGEPLSLRLSLTSL